MIVGLPMLSPEDQRKLKLINRKTRRYFCFSIVKFDYSFVNVYILF